MAQGIIGIVLATYTYDSELTGVGPFFVTIVTAITALRRAPISIRITFISQAYYSQVPQVQISSANVAKATRRVVIAVVRKESMVVRSSSILRDRFYNTYQVYSTAYIVYKTRSQRTRYSVRVVRVRDLFIYYNPALGAVYQKTLYIPLPTPNQGVQFQLEGFLQSSRACGSFIGLVPKVSLTDDCIVC